MSLDVSVNAIGGFEDPTEARATASVSMQEQVTITGGTGTGIAVLCVGGDASAVGYPGHSFNVGLSGQRESAYVGDGCAGPYYGLGNWLFGPVSAAADFTYGVPFDLSASMTADGGAPDEWEVNEFSADAQLAIVVVDPADPPDPPAAIPEPSSMVPCLMLGGYVLVRRLRAPSRSS